MKRINGLNYLLIRSLYGFVDFLVVSAIAFFSMLISYGTGGLSSNLLPILIYTFSLGLVVPLVFVIFRIYRIVTTNVSIYDSLKIFLITFGVNIAALVAVAFIPQLPSIQSFVLIWLLTAVVMSFATPSIRLFVRMFVVATSILSKQERVRTIIIGAGDMGKVALDETRRNRKNHNKVVAFVDDNPRKIGGSMSGIPIKGPISEIGSVVTKFDVHEVIIAISDISKDKLHTILETLIDLPVRVRRMPLVSEMEGPNDKRIIDVDLNELLCREPVSLDNKDVTNMLAGKTVLITGAGGSIGSELVRQVFKTKPATLILFDIYENSTYDIQQELVRKMRNENIKDVKLVTLIGSTYNEQRIEQIFKKYKPDYVYHAAAYKHVPLMEDSPQEAIRTNVIGTYNIAKTADKYGAKKMVLVSTDKAVRPTNVMGATKRFAEMIIQHFSSISKNTKYAAVRFGNVLGSNGSVVPLFKKQIEEGGPITITDKRITRYFMTIPEAVSLILQCGLFADGGEIFILDMGKPVRIMDLAEKLIRQAGLVPDVDIKVIETGLRPGEKLYEELLLDLESQQKTENAKIFIEQKETVNDEIDKEIKVISDAFEFDDANDVKTLLSSIIKTYTIGK